MIALLKASTLLLQGCVAMILVGAMTVAACSQPSTSISNMVKFGDERSVSNTEMKDCCLRIDTVWTGAHVDFGLEQTADHIFIGYYDKNRILKIAVIDKNLKKTAIVSTDDVFQGWDSHNYIVLKADRSSVLHIAGNMHNSVLRTYVLKPPFRQSDLAVAYGNAPDESKATYPQFINLGNNLLMLYRSGSSGKGEWRTIFWSKDHWTKFDGRALFASLDEGENVSAYPTKILQDKRGNYHVAAVWRRGPDVSTNYALTYAYSKDFKLWHNANAVGIPLPMSPEIGNKIFSFATGSGLFNNVELSLTCSDSPLIAFTEIEKNTNRLKIAHFDGKSWRASEVSDYGQLIAVAGVNTVPPPVQVLAFEGCNFGRPFIVYQWRGGPKYRQFLKTNGFQLDGAKILHKESASSDNVSAVVHSGWVENRKTIRDLNRKITYVMSWNSYTSTGDKPKICGGPSEELCPYFDTSLMLSRTSGVEDNHKQSSGE